MPLRKEHLVQQLTERDSDPVGSSRGLLVDEVAKSLVGRRAGP